MVYVILKEFEWMHVIKTSCLLHECVHYCHHVIHCCHVFISMTKEKNTNKALILYKKKACLLYFAFNLLPMIHKAHNESKLTESSRNGLSETFKHASEKQGRDTCTLFTKRSLPFLDHFFLGPRVRVSYPGSFWKLVLIYHSYSVRCSSISIKGKFLLVKSVYHLQFNLRPCSVHF